MSMFVWPDDTVTGSVNVAELESIQQGLKGVGKRKLARLPWPITSAEQLTEALDAPDEDDDSEPAKPAAKSSKADNDSAEALSNVDLPDLLDKATGKKGKS